MIEVIRFRVPAVMKERFEEDCRKKSINVSALMRSWVENHMNEVDALDEYYRRIKDEKVTR